MVDKGREDPLQMPHAAYFSSIEFTVIYSGIAITICSTCLKRKRAPGCTGYLKKWKPRGDASGICMSLFLQWETMVFIFKWVVIFYNLLFLFVFCTLIYSCKMYSQEWERRQPTVEALLSWASGSETSIHNEAVEEFLKLLAASSKRSSKNNF